MEAGVLGFTVRISVHRCGRASSLSNPFSIVELTARPRFSTALYGMIDLDSVGPRAIEDAFLPPVPAGWTRPRCAPAA